MQLTTTGETPGPTRSKDSDDGKTRTGQRHGISYNVQVGEFTRISRLASVNVISYRDWWFFNSKDVLDDVVDCYFHYCHKQPLWLFDQEEFAPAQNCSEETLLSILSLASCHSKHPFFQGRMAELSQGYAQAAREKILQRMGEGKVSLSTIQSLCILALANMQANNPTLLSLHIGMAETLAKCANLDYETCSPNDFGFRAESRRRLFWSLHLLQQMYGHQASATDILQNISRPQYAVTRVDMRSILNEQPPAIPREESDGTPGPGRKTGIWPYMIQLSTLWGEVRMYVKQWAQQTNNAPPPWSIESGYAVISAHLMDLETIFPTRHRFDLARFPNQDIQHLEDSRGYWSPWLYQQFTYHTIHNMLNHPFLYSSRPQQSTQLGVPNTFWKTSSELAFIHSTWVARLIDMVTNKAFRVSDPFLGHCAAIAATIHIYFCRAADKTTREAALNRLGRCVTFLADLASLWPSCGWLHEKLQALVRSAFAGDHPQEEGTSPRTISINTRLMWDILLYNFAAYRGTTTSGGLFNRNSFFPEDSIDEGEDIVEMDNFYNPTVEVTLSNGQALPPQSGQRRARVGQDQEMQSAAPTSSMTDIDTRFADYAHPTSWPMSLDIAYDPFFQFQDPGSPFFGTWEIGNL
ncbi:hypothetical protein F53441_11232 [Fusarium austroafricanum]|uniref:Xylanolytic transcriptional activator regulatory domain-containing protein n=1 Tax=Fusarium austroafricanum TaxID=2364996 RepID=A0A8H4K811_9HYPO|nr:hypothetical protein F53441_11232 [Fusarium austroafricanum]